MSRFFRNAGTPTVHSSFVAQLVGSQKGPHFGSYATCCFWVRKYDSYNGGIFIGKWDGSSTEWVVGMTGGNQVFIGVNGGGFFNGGGLTSGRWAHVMWAFNGGSNSHDLWLDGVYQGGQGSVGAHSAGTARLVIGNQWNSLGNNPSCEIAHVALWEGSARVDAVILAKLVKGMSPLAVPGLRGYWPLTEPGEVQHDLSGWGTDLYAHPWSANATWSQANPPVTTAMMGPLVFAREAGPLGAGYVPLVTPGLE